MAPRPRASRAGATLAAELGALAIVGLAAVPSVHAADIDAATGAARFSADAIKTYGFDTAADIVAAKISFGHWAPNADKRLALVVEAITDPAKVAPYVVAQGDAIQGSGALRVGNVDGKVNMGFAILDAPLFETLAERRVEITMWARGEGMAPEVSVFYGREDWTLMAARAYAKVSTTRTGRETSDGWVEYTSAAVEGAVWGAPIKAISLLPPPRTVRGTWIVDALEIRPAAGAPTRSLACTQADMEASCGPGGECMFGHCAPSSVVWGALPPAEHRVDFAERWIHFATRVMGDRNSAQIGRATFTPAVRDAARVATSSRQFFGALKRQVALLRDNHTTFGSGGGAGTAFGYSYGRHSAGLGACFGVVDKDLVGGGTGYAVFRASDAGLVEPALKVGDVLTAIDGKDPKAWVDDVYPKGASAMPNDPLADWAPTALELSSMITNRAKMITIARCASATKCTGGDRADFTIDVSPKVYERTVTTGSYRTGLKLFGCAPRFKNAVAELAPREDGDSISMHTEDGVVNAQFDGFQGGDKWDAGWSDVFSGRPQKILIDARLGNGGSARNVAVLLRFLRGKSDPTGWLSVARGGYDDADPGSIFKRHEACITGGDGFRGCPDAFGFFTDEEDPAGGKSRVAWLNTQDVSANDFLPRLIQGRTNLKIFAPHPTAGAFGAVTDLSTLGGAWGAGKIQYQDSRFAPTFADIPARRWESGHGVAPDVIVAQKVSDILADRDTMLETARKWLSE